MEAVFGAGPGTGRQIPLTLESIREVRLESRPWETIEFRNVALSPGRSTAVTIKDFAPAELASNPDAGEVRQEVNDADGDFEADFKRFGRVTQHSIAEPFPPDFVWFDLDAGQPVVLTNYLKPGWNPILSGSIGEAEARAYS
jgi:hypothetical protein